jgi:hypothetical protein
MFDLISDTIPPIALFVNLMSSVNNKIIYLNYIIILKIDIISTLYETLKFQHVFKIIELSQQEDYNYLHFFDSI